MGWGGGSCDGQASAGELPRLRQLVEKIDLGNPADLYAIVPYEPEASARVESQDPIDELDELALAFALPSPASAAASELSDLSASFRAVSNTPAVLLRRSSTSYTTGSMIIRTCFSLAFSMFVCF